MQFMLCILYSTVDFNVTASQKKSNEKVTKNMAKKSALGLFSLCYTDQKCLDNLRSMSF